MAAVTSPETTPQPRVYFQTPPGTEDEVPQKQGRVTVKYDRKELRKRLNLEEWIVGQLTQLYDCEEEEVPELEIDVDELLDLPSDADRALKVKGLLADCFKPTDVSTSFLFPLSEVFISHNSIQTSDLRQAECFCTYQALLWTRCIGLPDKGRTSAKLSLEITAHSDLTNKVCQIRLHLTSHFRLNNSVQTTDQFKSQRAVAILSYSQTPLHSTPSLGCRLCCRLAGACARNAETQHPPEERRGHPLTLSAPAINPPIPLSLTVSPPAASEEKWEGSRMWGDDVRLPPISQNPTVLVRWRPGPSIPANQILAAGYTSVQSLWFSFLLKKHLF